MAMEQKEKLILQGRDELRKHFRKGNVPSEKHFKSLIDSMANKLDDGFSKTEEYGMMMSPLGDSSRILSFFRSIDDPIPQWAFSRKTGDNAGLELSEPGEAPHLFLKARSDRNDFSWGESEEIKIGVGTSNPKVMLDVNGFAGIQGRVGLYKQGGIPADRQWSPILSNLSGCHCYEIVAKIVSKKDRQSFLQATVASVNGGLLGSKIKSVKTYTGWIWNRIRLRWVGTKSNFGLEISSARNWGDEAKVIYYVNKLWDDKELG